MDELEVVRGLNARWNVAYQQRDTRALEEILAPDWVGLRPDGSIGVNRPDMLRRTVENPPDTLDFSRETVRLLGTAAIVNGHLTAATSAGVHRQHYLRVFVKREGRWWAVVAQAIPDTGAV